VALAIGGGGAAAVAAANPLLLPAAARFLEWDERTTRQHYWGAWGERGERIRPHELRALRALSKRLHAANAAAVAAAARAAFLASLAAARRCASLPPPHPPGAWSRVPAPGRSEKARGELVWVSPDRAASAAAPPLLAPLAGGWRRLAHPAGTPFYWHAPQRRALWELPRGEGCDFLPPAARGAPLWDAAADRSGREFWCEGGSGRAAAELPPGAVSRSGWQAMLRGPARFYVALGATTGGECAQWEPPPRAPPPGAPPPDAPAQGAWARKRVAAERAEIEAWVREDAPWEMTVGAAPPLGGATASGWLHVAHPSFPGVTVFVNRDTGETRHLPPEAEGAPPPAAARADSGGGRGGGGGGAGVAAGDAAGAAVWRYAAHARPVAHWVAPSGAPAFDLPADAPLPGGWRYVALQGGGSAFVRPRADRSYETKHDVPPECFAWEGAAPAAGDRDALFANAVGAVAAAAAPPAEPPPAEGAAYVFAGGGTWRSAAFPHAPPIATYLLPHGASLGKGWVVIQKPEETVFLNVATRTERHGVPRELTES